LLLIGTLTAVCLTALLGVSHGPRFINVTGESAVAIQAGDLKPGSVEFYSYRDRAGAELRFLLARDPGGAIHGAMDACQRCYSYHKGYIASDGYLVCKLCGNRYKLATMESGRASCVPVKLPIQVSGQGVKIKSADLERQRGLF
jgi:uncharacterized membrane protein